MRKSLFFALLLGLSQSLLAQAPQEADKVAIQTVIDQLFDAMRANDSTMAAPLFHSAAQLTTVGGEAGAGKVGNLPYQRFVSAIGTPHDDVWDEKIANVKILIDGNFAIAWMDFTFYLGEQQLHCGVNMFRMLRTEAGWKILGITDTRRTSGCLELKN